MKKVFTLALSLVSVAMLSASSIDWDLPNLEDGSGASLLDGTSYSDGQSISSIVFLLATEATSVNSDGTFTGVTVASNGRNVVVDADDPITGYWEDDETGDNLSYVMAYFTGGKYYAISDGTESGYLRVDNVNNSSGDALIPSGASGSNTTSAYFSQKLTSGASTIAYSVPEPATAALALAGVAMLLRRRRVA